MLLNKSKRYFNYVKNWILELIEEIWNEARKLFFIVNKLTWPQKFFVVFRIWKKLSYFWFSYFLPNFFILIILLKSIFVLLKSYKDYECKNVLYNQINWKNYNKGSFLSKICFLVLFTNSFFYKTYFSNPKYVEIKAITQFCIKMTLVRILFFSFVPNKTFWFCLCYYSIYLINLQIIIRLKKIKKKTWEYFYTILPYKSFFMLNGVLNKNTETQYYNENLTKGFFCFVLLFAFFRITILVPIFALIIKNLFYFFFIL